MLGLLLLVSTMFLTSCAQGQGLSFSGVFDKVLSIGKLEFLGITTGENGLVGFMRIMVFILVFTIFYVGVRLVFNQQNIALVIAAVLAIISTIFIPGQVLAGIGVAYATIVSVVLIGAPIAGGAVALYMVPGTNRWLIALRICIILLMIWVLMAVNSHAVTIAGL